MPSSGDFGETKTTRRRYIKWIGSLALVGAAGVVFGEAVGRSLGQKLETTATDTVSRVSTTTNTVTETQTLTSTQTEMESPVTSIQTETVTDVQTDTQTLTSTQTTTQTLTDTQVETVTASPITSSSTSTSTTSKIPAATSNFSIFWITDTQFLSESNPALFGKLTDWIVSNWSTYNGKFVIHTGDIVQFGDQQVEWENASAAMTTLVQNGIPYTWCAGNHDDLVGGDPNSGWNGNVWAPTFDPSLAALQMNTLEYANWVGDYHDGMNTAAAFTTNGLNFLVVNLEWNPQSDALGWVGGLLDDPEYADHYVIIAPHAYMNAFGFYPYSSNGSDLTDFVTGLTSMMDKHSSKVFLTLNGHYATECGYSNANPKSGRNELMFDRQDCADRPGDPTGQGVDTSTSTTPDAVKVGGATVTILNFDTVGNQIKVSTYDVNTGSWRTNRFEEYTITMFPTSNAGTSTATAGATQPLLTGR